MAEVGSAYVSIMPSARGFGKQLNSQVGSQVESEGKKTGGRFTAAIGRGLKAGAIGVGATAAAGLGVALTKGFSRLKAIDEARAKLTGLGNSTKTVDNIMTNALNSVRGTAFGLGDAASVAAGTVAAGVKPGRELEKTLKLVADSATIAGTDLGSMGAIFNKVAASNKIQGDVIAQLSDAGIPIIQLLGKELGVSAEETVKLASAGKINFATFQKAMQSGLGGAAQKSGNTFSGALANVGAALGRVGAGLLGGIFPKMAPLFQKVTTALGPLETVAARVGEVVGGALANAFSFIADVAGRIDFGAIRDALSSVGSAISGFASGGGLSSFASSLQATGAAVFSFVQSLLPTLTRIGTQIMAVVGPALADIGRLIQTQFLPAFQRILPVVAPIAKFLLSIFGAAVVGALKGIVQAVKGLITFISGVFNVISALFTGDWPALWEGLKQVVSGALNAIIGVVRAWLNIGILAIFRRGLLGIRNLWQSLWNGLRKIATSAANALRSVASRIFNAIGAVIRGAVSRYFAIWRGLFRVLGQVAQAGLRLLRSAFSGALNAIRSVVSSALSRIRSAFSNAWSAIRSATSSAFGRIRGAVSTGIGNVVKLVRDLPGKAAKVIRDGAGGMMSAGKALIEGLVRGVAAKIGEAVEKVRAGLQRIKGLLPGSPIKWGPLKSWNNGGAGKRLMSMLADGLGYTKPVDQAMQRLTSRMSVADLSADVRATTAGLAASAIGGGGGGLGSLGPVRLVLADGRELDAYFEDMYDDMTALER